MPSLSFAIDLSRLLAPLSLIIFALLADIGTRLMVPGLRDYLQPLLGIPFTIWKWLQQKLARTNRNSRELQKRGALAVLVMVVVGILLALGLARVARFNPYIVYGVWFSIWGWSVAWTFARDVLVLPTPTTNSVAILAARRQINQALPDKADAATLYRVTMLAMCDTLVGGLAAPLFYTVLAAAFGQPSLYGAMIGVIGYAMKAPPGLDATQRLFYRPANAVAQLLFYLPGRLIALIMLVATLFTPRAKSWSAARIMITQGHLYPDQSMSWPVAVVSGAFGIAFPLTRGAPWLGDKNATAQIGKGALQRMVWLHVVTIMLTILILFAALLLSM